MKFNSQHSYKRPTHAYEEIKGESMTVPGEAMTLQQLMERYRAGMLPEATQESYLDPGDVDMITDFYAHGLDLTDLDMLKEQNALMYDAIQRAEANRTKAQEEKEDALNSPPQQPANSPGEPSTEPPKPADKPPKKDDN